MYKNRLKFLRERLGYTQKEIAQVLGIYKGLYCQYETEYEIIPLKHLNTLCNYFNVSIDYIFNFTENKSYTNSKDNIDAKLSGQRIKEFRKNNKLTQVKLIKILNIGIGTLSGYETGNYIIATHAIYTICKKYNISADYLLGKIDELKYLK